MKKKLIGVAMGAMLAAGAANAVTVGHAGLGDLLVAPRGRFPGPWAGYRTGKQKAQWKSERRGRR